MCAFTRNRDDLMRLDEPPRFSTFYYGTSYWMLQVGAWSSACWASHCMRLYPGEDGFDCIFVARRHPPVFQRETTPHLFRFAAGTRQDCDFIHPERFGLLSRLLRRINCRRDPGALPNLFLSKRGLPLLSSGLPASDRLLPRRSISSFPTPTPTTLRARLSTVARPLARPAALPTEPPLQVIGQGSGAGRFARRLHPSTSSRRVSTAPLHHLTACAASRPPRL